VTVRVGLEYALTGPGVDLRAGYIYDPTPIPTTRLTAALPDIDRHDLTVGASYHLGPSYNVDLGALWVIPGSRDTSSMPYEPIHKGSYEVTALVVSLSLGGRFGGSAE
jgi:long-chain fatty acid transport protein